MTRADEHAAWVRRNKGVKVRRHSLRRNTLMLATLCLKVSSEPAAGEAGSTVIFLSLGDAQVD